MTIQQIAQNCEMKFWDIVIPFMAEEGQVMKTINAVKNLFRSREGFMALLFLVWAAVGFVSGLVLGKLIEMVQIV